jgi:hypothetical protein
MFQNNIQGISKTERKYLDFIAQVITKNLKWKMAVKTCIQQKYAIYDFKSRMYPHRGQNLCRAIQMKVNYYQMVVTKLTTHADTLNTDILTLQEEDCKNQRI